MSNELKPYVDKEKFKKEVMCHYEYTPERCNKNCNFFNIKCNKYLSKIDDYITGPELDVEKIKRFLSNPPAIESKCLWVMLSYRDIENLSKAIKEAYEKGELFKEVL